MPTTTLNKYALIVAGGSGTRMNSDAPKQFMLLGEKPLLLHTIQRFLDYSKDLQIILVLPPTQIDQWKSLCEKYNLKTELKIVTGGETRFQSVKNGLNSISNKEGLIAIHDGVRPFVKRNLIEDSFAQAEKYGNAITAVELKDSIRSLRESSNKSEERKKFRLIQTPQTFRLSLIKKAYEANENSFFTDDASVLESMGEKIHLIEGSYENIKITTPEDFILAEGILKGLKF
jgi:2-C-methyl-D-erythritol 4-phosphate cytidylyltransferase